MDTEQARLDRDNRALVEAFLQRMAPGELIGAVVTVRTDATGLGWYPVLESQSGVLLDMLRTKPDEVHIERKS